MHIWNTQLLVDELRAGPLSEDEQFKYFATFVMLTILGWSIPIDSDAKGWLGNYGFWCWLVYGVIGLMGLVFAYSINRQHDNRHFIIRFVSISIPITIQLFTLMGVVLALAALLPDIFPEGSSRLMTSHGGIWDWFWFSLQILLEMLYFLRITNTIRKVVCE